MCVPTQAMKPKLGLSMSWADAGFAQSKRAVENTTYTTRWRVPKESDRDSSLKHGAPLRSASSVAAAIPAIHERLSPHHLLNHVHSVTYSKSSFNALALDEAGLRISPFGYIIY